MCNKNATRLIKNTLKFHYQQHKSQRNEWWCLGGKYDEHSHKNRDRNNDEVERKIIQRSAQK